MTRINRFIVCSLIFAFFLTPLQIVGIPSTATAAESAGTSQALTHRFDQIVEKYGVTPDFLQTELEKGLSLQDVKKALDAGGRDGYSDAIQAVKPKPANRSKGAKSTVDSQIGTEQYDSAATVSMMTLNSTDYSYVNTKPESAPYTVSLDQENISTLTGGLSISYVDFVLPGRNGLSFALTRTYDSGTSQFAKMTVDGYGTNQADKITYEEMLFPIGKGWSWNIPSIEYSNDKKYVHLSEKGTYKLDGTTLKGYPWLDLTYATDTSVTVGTETSADKVTVLGGITYHFGGDGRLIRITDAYANTITFFYSQHPTYGKVLSTIMDAIGNSIQIAYNETSVTLTKGTEVVTYYKLQQNGKELLGKVIDPSGRETTYDYLIAEAQFNLVGTTPTTDNPYALLTGVHHPTGAQTLYAYETSPVNRYIGENAVNQAYRVQSRKDRILYENGTFQDVNVKTISYTGDAYSSYNLDLTFSVSINDGIQVSTFENKKDYIDTNTSPVFYNMKIVRTAGNLQRTTSYTYDEARRWYWPVTETTQMKNTTTAALSPVAVVTRSYDDYANVVTETDPQGARTDYTYDPTSHLLSTVTQSVTSTLKRFTSYTRNAQGSVTGVVVRENNESGTLLQQVWYENFDLYGNVTRVRVKDNTRDLITDTLFGAAHNYAFPTSQSTVVKDADNVSSTITRSFVFNTGKGTLSSYIDGRGKTTAYEYDVLGRVTKVTYPGGAVSTIRYDDFNNQITAVDETGITTYMRWDPLGRKTDVGFVVNNGLQAKVKYGYDAHGRTIWTEDALGNQTTYQYNEPWGRQTAIVSPQNHATTITYDDIALKQRTTDAEGVVFESVLDILGRETAKYEVKGATYVLLGSNTYDYLGNVRQAVDGKAKTITYGYDALGRLTSVTNPLSQTTSYTYSLAGHLTTITHPDTKTIQRAYDELGRLVKQTDANGGIEKQYYDGNGNLVRLIDRKGQEFTYAYTDRNWLAQKYITGVSAETVSFTYDNAGRRLSMKDATSATPTTYSYSSTTGHLQKVTFPDGRSIIYDYDAQGNRRQMTDPFGYNVYYGYDSSHRLTSVGSALQDAEATYTYFNNGLVASVTQKNGVKTAYTYDGLKLDTLTHRKPDNAVIYSYNYDYDGNSNITSIVEGAATHSFGYDNVNRITSSSILNQSFTYDSRGNRDTFSSQNPPESPDAMYSYDKRDQLTQVAVTGGPTVTYKYNGDGLMYERTEGSVTTRYYYDGPQVIAEGTVVNGVAKLKARYIRGRELVAREDASYDKTYYLHNGHGDVVELRDASGVTALNRYSYDIWGNHLSSYESVDNPFRYSGEYWDQSTSLQYLRARWYDPSMGRFISEDTYEGDITNPLSLNLYTYVENNPLIYVDPTGHYKKSDNAELRAIVQPFTDAWNLAFGMGDTEGMKEAEMAADAARVSYYGRKNLPDDVKYRNDTVDMLRERKYGNAKEVSYWDDPLHYLSGTGEIKAGAKVGLSLLKSGLLAIKAATKVADHHIMPKFRGNDVYANFFSSRGINVDDYTVTISHGKDSHHLKFIHGQGQWNETWKTWIDANPNATRAEIFQQAGRMMDLYGLSGLKIHPYQRK